MEIRQNISILNSVRDRPPIIPIESVCVNLFMSDHLTIHFCRMEYTQHEDYCSSRWAQRWETMTEVPFAFGKSGISVPLPSGAAYEVVESRSAPALRHVHAALDEALDHPIAGLPLRTLA